MTILLTGGTGKTSSRIAAIFKQQGTPTLIASRSGPGIYGFAGCKFDWMDESTYGNPFTQASHITAIYLVGPMILDKSPPVKKFIDYSVEQGVKRFVLLSASALEPGGPSEGTIHQYLIDRKVEYSVLRPTWFMENFSEQLHLPTIRNENKFFTAAGKGKVPFVAAEDIAAAAARLLTDPKPHNRDYLILGPQLLDYDEVAKILSETLGREITHVNLSQPELSRRMQSAGIPLDYAEMLSHLSEAVSRGSDEKTSTAVKDITGKEPMSFRDFVVKNKAAWVV